MSGHRPHHAADAGHDRGDPAHVSVLVVTVSDTRTEADDTSGRLILDALRAAGHAVAGYHIVPDDADAIARMLDEVLPASRADVAILTGGTGITARDGTHEVVSARLEKRLDGFGELFRSLSYDEIGPRALLSRAVAGTRGRTALFALPGSRAAVWLGMEKLILPVLGHLKGQLAR